MHYFYTDAKERVGCGKQREGTAPMQPFPDGDAERDTLRANW